MTPAQVEAYVDAAAAAIGLTLDARHRSGVIAYLSLAATMAAQLDTLPLGVADEPAGPTFVPIGPDAALPDAALPNAALPGDALSEDALSDAVVPGDVIAGAPPEDRP